MRFACPTTEIFEDSSHQFRHVSQTGFVKNARVSNKTWNVKRTRQSACEDLLNSFKLIAKDRCAPNWKVINLLTVDYDLVDSKPGTAGDSRIVNECTKSLISNMLDLRFPPHPSVEHDE